MPEPLSPEREAEIRERVREVMAFAPTTYDSEPRFIVNMARDLLAALDAERAKNERLEKRMLVDVTENEYMAERDRLIAENERLRMLLDRWVGLHDATVEMLVKEAEAEAKGETA